jgi:glycosyltransferase involved in cell wall biosynthesis
MPGHVALRRPGKASQNRLASAVSRRFSAGVVEAVANQQRAARREHEGTELEVRLEAAVQSPLAVGRGNALVVWGTCFHSTQPIEELRVGVAGSEARVLAHGMPRPDLLAALHPALSLPVREGVVEDDASEQDPMLMSYRSGFWGIVPLEPVEEPTSAELGVTARLADGSRVSASLGRIELDPGLGEAAAAPGNGRSAGPLVAICMATFEPPLDLFERQVDSIRAQTHANWLCLISDDGSSPSRFADMEHVLEGDPRFVLSRAPRRLGYYHNFERALSMTPASAAYATFADQDDLWHPDKLETLLGAIGDASLVYSDARIVDRNGRLLSDTYWSARRNNYTNLASLLIANTVSGAASLFPRELLERALPFPPRHGRPFHDHWVASVALASGRIAYVDRPLYDYVQHGGAALGHSRANLQGARLGARLTRLRGLLHRPRATVSAWRGIYFWDVCRLVQFGTVLELRCGERMAARKKRAVRLLSAAEHSPWAMAWLWLRRARALIGRTETLGAESALLRGIAWRHAVAALARGRKLPPARFGGNAIVPPLQDERRNQPLTTHPEARTLFEKIEPLELDVRQEAPVRINLLVPTIDLKHFFGGYITKLNLARRLIDRGLRVRLVTVDKTPPLPRSWRRQVESYSGLEGLVDRLEVFFGREGGPLVVSPADRFIATTWWTAHVARDALRRLEASRFLYLIQEYEPFTFPMGAFAALARQSYDLPHFALFSSELLRDYFRLHGIGVYSDGVEPGDRRSAAFANAITRVDAPSEAELAGRAGRRLLFYARPESHASRNMFELGVLGLAQAVGEGVLGPEWELHGIGGVEAGAPIDLGDGTMLEMLPRRDQHSYAKLLRSHDAGLALMYTPHPSLVPIEMASAGMLTVTNSFENKTAAAMAAISPNLITVEPSVEGVQAGLREAVARVDDYERRTEGSHVHWSRDWDDSFDNPLIDRVTSFLDAC